MNKPARDMLIRYADWLSEEAIPAGGLGPHETGRVWERHLADSLLFAGAWPGPEPPRDLLDLGSGVGLPGIPLAALWPVTAVQLVDRSLRRVQLARRAVRVLGLDNVEVLALEAAAIGGSFDLVVARAAATPELVAGWALPRLASGGRLVIGGSHVEAPEAGPGEAILAVPPEVLDRPVWLRMMAAP